MKTLSKLLPIAVVLFGIAGLASAHVVVHPKEVGIGKFQTFTVSVPSEKESATIGLRLLLPEGLNHITPTVKHGWKIELKTQITGNKAHDHDGEEIDEEIPTEIIWTGGNIPGHHRDDFSFSAQVPASATTLQWKAYQTYADRSVVAWDQASGEHPFSTTKVINDLTTTPSPAPAPPQETTSPSDSGMATIALAISIVALVLVIQNRKEKLPNTQ